MAGLIKRCSQESNASMVSRNTLIEKRYKDTSRMKRLEGI